MPPSSIILPPSPPSMVILTEVIGDQDRLGQLTSISPLLPIIDVAAGRSAFEISQGPVVTGSFDDLQLFTPLYHGDIISFHADVIAKGTCSMLLQVNLYRDSFNHNGPFVTLIAICFTTFVAVDETGKARPIPRYTRDNISSLSLHSSFSSIAHIDLQQHADQDPFTTHEKCKMDRDIIIESDLQVLRSRAELRSLYAPLYKSNPEILVQDIQSTLIRIRKQFLPRHRNMAGNIFGGDILQALEQTAVACANRIQQGKVSLRTIAIRSLRFIKHVTIEDVLQIEAKVIATSERVLCVIVCSYLSGQTDAKPCHTGIFHLIPIERDGADNKLAAGVPVVWERRDQHINDFYRAMALPLKRPVKRAWHLEDDPFPSEKEERVHQDNTNEYQLEE